MVLLNQMAILLAILFLLFVPIVAYADIYKYVADDGTIFFTNTPSDRYATIIERENGSDQNTDKYEGDLFFHYTNIAEEKAKKYEIDPQLIKAIIKVESNWNPRAVSPKGALGLMQLMPSTASLMGVINPFNPKDNIEGGVRYLKYLLEKFKGNLTLALAAYNAGPKKVEKIMDVPPITETITYVRRVMNYYSGGKDMPLNKLNTSSSEIKKSEKIQRIVLNDGTLLFTNSFNLGEN